MVIIPLKFRLYDVSSYFINNALEYLFQSACLIVCTVIIILLYKILAKATQKYLKILFYLISLFYRFFVWNFVFMHLIAVYILNTFHAFINIVFIPVSIFGRFNSFLALLMIFVNILILLHFIIVIKVCNRLSMEMKHLGVENNLRQQKLDNPIIIFMKEPLRFLMFKYLP